MENRSYVRVFQIALALAVMVGSLDADAARRRRRSGNIGGGSQSGSESADPLCNNSQPNSVRRVGCDAIMKQLTDENSCTKKLMDSIAQRASRGLPSGFNSFCPNYAAFNGDPVKRAMIWRNVIAALIQEEASWVPSTTGDRGKSKGLMQLSEGDADNYSCGCSQIRKGIFNVSNNVRCGTHIVMHWVNKNWIMGSGNPNAGTAQGIARYYGPFGDHQKHKRERMGRKVSAYCKGLPMPGQNPPPSQIIARPSPPPAAPGIIREKPQVNFSGSSSFTGFSN